MDRIHRAPARGRLARLSLLAMLIASPPTWAAEGEQPEEMIVTGSYIRGSAEDAALPVDVLTQQDLLDQGAPTIVEMVRNLNVTSGNVGETNQFQGGVQGTEGAATINLRGLGSARTLVLINGHRTAATEALGVDINAIPSTAIGRLEVLKDGAAALYGSDAIGGVVNFITRAGFEGLEIKASEQFVEDSDGDHEVAFVYGWAGENMDFLIAGEWQRRSELQIIDRDWAIRSRAANPQGGYSGISNPGPIRLAAAAPAPGALQPGITGSVVNDPGCATLLPEAGGCFFQFTRFDNLVEPQDTYRSYAEFNYTINENHQFHAEVIYSTMQMHHWKTSPSYPPQSLFGPDRYIAPNHPGLVALRATQDLGVLEDPTRGVYSQSRYLGATGFYGDPQQGVRETDTYRYGGSLSGSLFNDALDYELAGYYSKRKRHVSGQDMFVERMAFALDGLGGPNCNLATGVPGVGGCQFYNPFSNAVRQSVLNGFVNPDFNPALANSPELTRWLIGKQASVATNELFVIDFVVSGETPFSLGGGPVSFAVGGQTRNEKYDLTLNDATNVDEFPCQFNNQRSVTLGNVSQADFDRCQAGLTSPTGPFAFLSGTTEERTSRTIYGVFAELALPFSDTLDVQAAIRFEDYGGEVGSSIDPKLAIRWQALDWLAFRGSISTTFRGPPQSFLSGTATSLIFIAPANAFKAVDVIGNESLKPETALARNLGLIIDAGGFYASVDYWRFDFEDPLQTESSGQIVAAYVARGCAGATSPSRDCDFLRSHVFPTGITAALLERVDTNFINGGDITTSGVDFFVQYDFEDPILGGELSLGGEATYTIEFDSADFPDINGFVLAPGGDFAGLLNDTTPFPSKPQVKGALFARYVNGSHRYSNYVRYTDDYTDSVPPAAATYPAGANPRDFSRVDTHITWDMTYSVGLLDEKLNLTASITNILDNDPPRTAQDLNYDPFSHSPAGRTIKVGFSYTLGAE